MKMRIAIYHPGLTTFGGGETVALTIAEHLSQKHKVEILTHHSIDKKKLEEFFGVSLEKVQIRKLHLQALINKLPSFNSVKRSVGVKLFLRNSKLLNSYDLVIDTGTNGWFDRKIQTKTLCYVHFPLFQSPKRGLKAFLNSFLVKPAEAFKYDKILCNSKFTLDSMQSYTSQPTEIINPPVLSKELLRRSAKAKKKNIILSVGRFSPEKKHEVLISAFRKLHSTNKDWELHIIGSFRKEVAIYQKGYYEKLLRLAEGLPVFFHQNMPHEKVMDFMATSKIYWHARGYGETNLTEYENFGITTVEAMAAGCVPIVINLGAQPEIVNHSKNGFVWNEPEELIRYTQKIIDNTGLMQGLSKKARQKSLQYDISIFREKILKIAKTTL